MGDNQTGGGPPQKRKGTEEGGRYVEGSHPSTSLPLYVFMRTGARFARQLRLTLHRVGTYTVILLVLCVARRRAHNDEETTLYKVLEAFDRQGAGTTRRKR